VRLRHSDVISCSHAAVFRPILIKYSYNKYGVEKAVYDEQNALILTYEHLRTQNFFWGSYPGPPVIRGGEGKGDEDRKWETRGWGGWF
jgi:hypothetical protein